MDLSLVIPTHNRADVLASTLAKLARLDEQTVGERCELIIVDNGSDAPPEPPRTLDNGIETRVIALGENRSAAARNVGAEQARADWIVMLDDDSSLEKSPAIDTLRAMPSDVHAVGGEILLPNGAHESGGLPEVVIGCGCAYRRDVFNALGGYDASFDFYAEEYDLCARVLRNGGRVVHTSELRFEHRKSAQNRSFARIIHRLVRNNGWVIKRYTPEDQFLSTLDRMLERYERIARKEGVAGAFANGLDELERTIDQQQSNRMDSALYARFTGAHACAAHLRRALKDSEQSVRLIELGKGAEIISSVLTQLGHRIAGAEDKDAIELVGTLSPGPMHDAMRTHPDAIQAWSGFASCENSRV
jgi:GT2 family glycosyltransferase